MVLAGAQDFPSLKGLARGTAAEAPWGCDDVTMLLENAVFYQLKLRLFILPIWRGDDVTWRCYSSIQAAHDIGRPTRGPKSECVVWRADRL